VVRHLGDNDHILESGPDRRMVASPLFDLGWLCGSAQFFNLAVEFLVVPERAPGSLVEPGS